MDTDPHASPNLPAPAGGGRFSWPAFAVWLPTGLILGIVAALLADVAEEYFAPAVLFPLLVGAALGVMVVGLIRVAQVGHRRTIVAGTLLGVATAVVGQHYLAYLAECRRAEQEIKTFQDAHRAFPELVRGPIPEPPEGLLTYLRRQAHRGRPLPAGLLARGSLAWLSWGIDGLLVLLAAFGLVFPALRQPYCNRCGSWYRTTRSGRIGGPAARRLAELAEISPAEQCTAGRYRLLNCSGGCGPTAFELSQELPGSEILLARTWLDPLRRDRIGQALDEARAASSSHEP